MTIILFIGLIMGGLQTFIDWNFVRFFAFDVRKLVVYVPVAVLNLMFSVFPLLIWFLPFSSIRYNYLTSLTIIDKELY